jgi:hypothetical protein
MTEFTTRPLPPEAYIGRARELGVLLDRTVFEGPPLVSLTGPSKIGRTSYLLKLASIAATSGAGSEYRSLFHGVTLVTPLFDLRELAGGETDRAAMRKMIAGVIGAEMQKRKLRTPSERDLSRPGGLESLIDAMTDIAESTRFMLLFDGAEFLPGEDASPTDHDPLDGVLEIIGKLINSAPSCGVVLSFGVGGRMRELGVDVRAQEHQARVRLISDLFALPLLPITLGLLGEDDVKTYAARQVIKLKDGSSSKPEADEIRWLVEVAGGHPYVLNCAGLQLRKLREGGTTADAERTTGESIAVFVDDIARRLKKVPGAFSAVVELAGSAQPVSQPVYIAEVLSREGVAVAAALDDSEMDVRMPSRALRLAFLALRATRSRAAVHAGGQAEMPAGVPHFAVWRIDANGSLRTARMTPSECDLLLLLMGTEGIVSVDDLLAELEDDVEVKQLIQRLSAIRTKLMRDLGILNPIHNVYGRGYRWVASPEVQLRCDT